MKVHIEEISGLEDLEILVRVPRIDSRVMDIVTALSAFDKKLHGTDGSGGIRIVEAREVLYLEAVNGSVFAYTKDAVLRTSLKLEDAEVALETAGFARASRCFIVNLAHVESITPTGGAHLLLTMDNGEDVLASRAYSKAIKRRLGIIS